MLSKKYHNWLLRVQEIAIYEQVTELQDIDKVQDKLQGWYNAGHSPEDIVDNFEFILNPHQP